MTDNGRGIPVDMHQKRDVCGSGLYSPHCMQGESLTILRIRQAAVSMACGSSVVNALSTYMDVKISRDGPGTP